jgi:hypothetical protein
LLLSSGFFVPAAIAAKVIGGRERLAEMPVEFCGRRRREPANARLAKELWKG